MNKLWTKDFTIITLGTVISMFGSAVSGFAMGLLVLDYTGSTLMYAIYMVCYSLPRVIMPIIAGPYLDNFSRKKMIYLLDFFSAGLFALISFLLWKDFFSFPLLVGMAIIVGTVDSIYSVAYESLYPTLISEGNFSKAYSVSSLIYPLANTIMVPIAGICYNTIGLLPLFIFNSVSFLVAAIFETRIGADESHLIGKEKRKINMKVYIGDLREGVDYLRSEKGLLAIALYFFVMMLGSGVGNTLTLPFFKSFDFSNVALPQWLMQFAQNEDGLGVGIYTLVMSVSTVGRLIGGLLHYRFRYPVAHKFTIAIVVYIVVSFIEGLYLFAPVIIMMILMLFYGALGVTSYNIRISATQNYVPNEKRGRFNGIFHMINMLGMTLGQLIAGALGDIISPRLIILVANILCIIFCFVIMIPKREEVKLIYNREA